MSIAFAGVKKATRPQHMPQSHFVSQYAALTERAEVVGRPVVRADEARVRLGLAVPAVVDTARERAGLARPVVVRDEVPVRVERRLRLLPDHAHDLADRGQPCESGRIRAGQLVGVGDAMDAHSSLIKDVSFVAW